MKLPSKTTPYKGSVLAQFPPILAALTEGDFTITELYHSMPEMKLGDYISALDCLYALGKIEIDIDRGTIYYAEADSL